MGIYRQVRPDEVLQPGAKVRMNISTGANGVWSEAYPADDIADILASAETPATLPVFPCAPDKSPLVAGGFKSATTEAAQIAAWQAQYPDALWGVPTGAVSGFVVVDLDTHSPDPVKAEGARKWAAENMSRLPATRVVQTRSGGKHVFFRAVRSLRCSAGSMAPGVDIRAEGGYIIDWSRPGAGGKVLLGGPIAAMPAWLLLAAAQGQTETREQGDPLLMTPPSAEAVAELIAALPYEPDYGDWAKLGLAAANCAKLIDDPEGKIREAFEAWSDVGAVSNDKWKDWNANASKAGWHTLVNYCRNHNPDYPPLAEYLDGIKATEADREFGDLLLDPETPEQRAEAERHVRPAAETPTTPPTKPAPLGDIGTLAWWERRTLTEPAKLLGSFITLPSKTWLAGQTGLGKSMFAMGAAIGIASGSGFLHWTCERPARVLYLDGEMGARAVRARLLRAAQERGEEIGDRLRVFSPDDMDDLARLLGQQNAPLNTEAGRRFVVALADYVDAEVIIVDNFMAFCTGDMKDTAAWQGTKPLVDHWHVQGKAQLWLDHTGMDGSRQYGDSTKRWGFETVGVLLALGKVRPDEIHVTLTFSAEHYGKHRHRVASNWGDFNDHDIHLENGTWRSVARDAVQVKNPEAKAVTPQRKSKAMHEVLLKMVSQPGASVERRGWFNACEAAGVLATESTVPDPNNDDDVEETKKAKKREKAFRRGVDDLRHCGWVHQTTAGTFQDSRRGVPIYQGGPDDDGPGMAELLSC